MLQTVINFAQFFARLKIPTLVVLFSILATACSSGGGGGGGNNNPTSTSTSSVASSTQSSSSSVASSQSSTQTTSSASSTQSSDQSSQASSSTESSATSSTASSDLSSQSSSDTSSSSSVQPSPTALQGQVKGFPDTDNAQSKIVQRKIYDPAVASKVGQSKGDLMFQAGEAGGGTLSQSDMVPASALVSLFLLSDVDFANPVATVRTDSEGNYTVRAADVLDYLVAHTPVGHTISPESSEDDVLAAFRALGKLQVRALVVKEKNGVQRALAIQSIADPEALDHSMDPPQPIPVAVNPIVHRITKTIVDQIKESIQSLRTLGIAEETVNTLTQTVIASVTPEIERVISEAADSVIEIPEGQSREDVVGSQEDEFEVVFEDSTKVDELAQVLQTTDETDEQVIKALEQDAAGANDAVSAEDSTLESTLDSESQGLLSGLQAALDDAAISGVEEQIEAAQNTEGGLEALFGTSAEESAAALEAAQAENLRQQRIALQRFFLSMGLAVVVDENAEGTAGVVALRLQSPFHVPKADIPGGTGFGERNIRLFKVGEDPLDDDSNYQSETDPDSPDLSPEQKAALKPYAQPFAEVVSSLRVDFDGNVMTPEDFQIAVDDAFLTIADLNAIPTPNDYRLNDKVNLYHDLNRRLQEVSLVSSNVIERVMAAKGTKVQMKVLAKNIADNFSWYRRVVNLTPEGFPVFLRTEPLSGTAADVASSEVLSALSLPLADSAKDTAAIITQRRSFFAQYAPEAVQAGIERARFLSQDSSEPFNLITALQNVYPDSADGYRDRVIGGNGFPAAPSYLSARDRVALGLTSSLPVDLFGKTLTSESEINIRTALFLLDFVSKGRYLVDKAQGYFREFPIDGQTRYIPYFSNYKFLKPSDGVSVGTIVSALLNVTEIANGDFFSTVRTAVSVGLDGLPTLPEFKEQDLSEFEDDLSARNDTVALTCTVERFDGSDPLSETDSAKSVTLSIAPVEFDPATGQFYKQDSLEITPTSEVISAQGEPVKRRYSFAGISSLNGDNYGMDYVLRFNIPGRQNALPELFFFVDGFAPSLDLCGDNEPYFIGRDKSAVHIPGLGLVADQQRVDFVDGEEVVRLEGVDLSNIQVPGGLLFLTDREQLDGLGLIDFVFVTTDEGFELQAVPGSGVKFAPLFGGYVENAFSASIDPNSGLDPLYGLETFVGAKVRALIESLANHSDPIPTSIEIPSELTQEFLHRLYLMIDAEGKYWVIELRYLDVPDFEGALPFLDIGFARINSLGEVVAPDLAFDSGPVFEDGNTGGGLQFHTLYYGDWLVLKKPGGYSGPHLLPPAEVFIGDDPSYEQLAQATDGVVLRYAGDHFEDNILSFEDIDALEGDYSSIPVRLDAGHAGVTFVKLSFNKQDRKYLMNPLPENATDFAGQLKHNNIVAIFENSTDTPAFIARVVRRMDPSDPGANFQIDLEVINFAEFSADDSPENDVVCFADISAEDCPPELPTLVASVDGVITTKGAVYDADFDGVPALFDPNDSDPNIPGAAPTGGGVTNPGGGASGEGLHISMMAEADGAGGVSRSFLVETENVYPGDILSVVLESAMFGAEAGPQLIFSCDPPKDVDGEFVDYQCSNDRDPAGDVTVSLQGKSGDRIGFKLAVPSTTLDTLGNRTDVKFTINFRKPLDLQGNAFMCGSEECPARPPISGVRTVNIMPEVAVLADLTIEVGSEDPVSLSNTPSIDVSRPLAITGAALAGAKDYELNVFCPGSEPGAQPFYHEENFFFWAPARDDTGRAIKPRFDFDLSWLSGRTCSFRVNAFMESSSGEFLGLSSITIDDKSFEGELNSGFIDQEIKVGVDGLVCLETAADGWMSVTSEGCTEEGKLFSVASVGTDGEPVATLDMGAVVTEAHIDGGRAILTEGQLNAGAIVAFNVDLSVPEDQIVPPNCGSISNEPHAQFCPDDVAVSSEFFVVAEGSLRIIDTLASVAPNMIFALRGDNLNEDGSIPLDVSGFYRLVTVEDSGEHEIVEIGIDAYAHDGVVDTWAKFTLVAGGAHYEPGETTSFDIASPGFVRIDTVDGQPVDLDVRFIRDGIIKFAWFLPPPVKAVAGAHDLDGDEVADVTITGSAGAWNIVFREGTQWVEFYGYNGAEQLEPQSDGTYMMDLSLGADNGYAGFGLSLDNGLHFNLNIDYWGDGEGNLSWFDVAGGGHGGGDPGTCADCPVPLFEFAMKEGDAVTLFHDDFGFNFDSGAPVVDFFTSGDFFMVELAEGNASGQLAYWDETGQQQQGSVAELEMFDFFGTTVDYLNSNGESVFFEIFDNGFDISVRVWPLHHEGPGDGGGEHEARDFDMDGIFDHEDNCFLVANEDQLDDNQNGIGDVCEAEGPDMAGIYMLDLAYEDGSQEFDEHTGSCVDVSGTMTYIVEVKTMGSQFVLRPIHEDDPEGGLRGLVDANGGIGLIDHHGLQGSGQYDDVTHSISIQFTEVRGSDDGQTSCAMSATVSGAGPTEVNEQAAISGSGIGWFEFDMYETHDGYFDGYIEYGVLEESMPEAMYSWDFELQDWVVETAETGSEYFLEPSTGALIAADDVYMITGYLDAGEVAVIEPLANGNVVGGISANVDLAEFDLTGVSAMTVLPEEAVKGLPEDFVFDDTARGYLASVTQAADSYSFECDDGWGSWFESNLECDNIVSIAWDGDVPTPAISLDEVVVSQSEVDAGLGGNIIWVGDVAGKYEVQVHALLLSDDSSATGGNLIVRYITRDDNTGKVEFITQEPAVLTTLGDVQVIEFVYPEVVMDMLEDDYDKASFVFVESTLEGTAMARVGRKQSAGETEMELLFNGAALAQIADNFSMQLPDGGAGCPAEDPSCVPECPHDDPDCHEGPSCPDDDPECEPTDPKCPDGGSTCEPTGEGHVLDIPVSEGWRINTEFAWSYETGGVMFQPTANEDQMVYDLPGMKNMNGAAITFYFSADADFIASGASIQPFVQQKYGTWVGHWDCWIDNGFLDSVGEYTCMLPETGWDITDEAGVQLGLQIPGADLSSAPAGSITITGVVVELMPPCDPSTEQCGEPCPMEDPSCMPECPPEDPSCEPIDPTCPDGSTTCEPPTEGHVLDIPVSEGWRINTEFAWSYETDGVMFQPTANGDQMVYDLPGMQNLNGASLTFYFTADADLIASGASVQPFVQQKYGDWEAHWGCWMDSNALSVGEYTCTLPETGWDITDEAGVQLGFQIPGAELSSAPAGSITITGVMVELMIGCDPSMEQCEGPMGDPAAGLAAYKDSTNNCSLCHNNDPAQPGLSEPPLLPLKSQYALTSGDMVDLATYIELEMPDGSPEGCDRQCAEDIAAYLRHLDKEPMGDPVAGKTAYEQTELLCTSCHTSDPTTPGQSAALAPIRKTYELKLGQNQEFVDLATYIELEMPQGGVENCGRTCAEDIAAYLYQETLIWEGENTTLP